MRVDTSKLVAVSQTGGQSGVKTNSEGEGRTAPSSSCDSVADVVTPLPVQPLTSAVLSPDESFNESCCCDADDMAGNDDRAEKYIMDIPYSVLFNIVQSLDADKGWEALAAETGYTFNKIRLLELEGARLQGSPARSLLLELGSRNTTIRQLYGHLSAIRRYREMKILEDYVNSAVPSSSLTVDNGLKGLKSSESAVETSDSLKGLKPPKLSVTPEKKGGSSSTICTDSINFNQLVSGCDGKNSLGGAEKDKQYTGKQMPVATAATSTLSNSSDSHSNGNMNLDTIKAPMMKPSVVPSVKTKAGPSSGNRTSCASGGPVSSSFSYGPQAAPSSSSSAMSPLSEIPSSSSLSSMSSLPAWLDSSMEMQVAVIGTARFTYSELRQATADFSDNNKLGEGAFGTVYYGVLRDTKCAVKKMAEVNSQDTCLERSSQIKREMTSLLKFRHENLVTLYGYAVDGPSLCLVYQFMPNGSLEDRLLCRKGTAPLQWAQRLNIMMGACQGLNFLHTIHDQPLIHGDIKSANILLDKHLEARLGDLGQAQQATGCDSATRSRMTHITRAQASTKLYGTRAYQPSEVQSGGKLSTKSDIFAMGVVLLEVFSGQPAYDDRREGDRGLVDYFRNNVTEMELDKWLVQMDSRAGECPHAVVIAMLRLAYRCTNTRKKDRPTSTELLKDMTDLEQQYRDATDSMLGSEHSCHVSHTSSPDNPGADNLTGAPHLLNTGLTDSPASSPSQLHKHFVASPQMHQHGHKCPDNRLAVNLNQAETSDLQTAETQQRSEGVTPSPIEYFPKGQPLPAPFRLQQEYDRQKEGQAERKQIQRLSECYPVRHEVPPQGEETLPQADPRKMAELEEFDRLNLGQEMYLPDADFGDLRSDPKKLAVLKQFDQEQKTSAAGSQENGTGEEGTELMACDPKKLAQLQQFDKNNVASDGNTVDSTSDTTGTLMASDPRKLSYLRDFDDKNYTSSSLPTKTSHCEPSSMTSSELFPVSQLDYVINTSQKEALRSCNESLHHSDIADSLHQRSDSTTFQPGASSVQAGCSLETEVPPITSIDNVANTSQERQDLKTSATESYSDVAGDEEAVPNGTPTAAMMLARRNNMFHMYEQAMQGFTGDDDNCDEEFYEGDNDDGGDDIDEDCNNKDAVEIADVNVNADDKQDNRYGEKQLEQIRICHHPHPTEQDEEDNINLNYYKERAKYYSKTFKKA